MKITAFLSKLSPQGKSTVITNTNTVSSMYLYVSQCCAGCCLAAWLHGCLLSCRHEITISHKLRARGANLSYYFHQTEKRKKGKGLRFLTDNKKQNKTGESGETVANFPFLCKQFHKPCKVKVRFCFFPMEISDFLFKNKDKVQLLFWASSN